MAFDLFATFLRAAGGAPAGVVDGVDLLPFLRGDVPGLPHRYLFWGKAGVGATRRDKWKLVGTSSTTSTATSARR